MLPSSTQIATDWLSMAVDVGLPVPPHTPHAISVSLPKWRDVVGYEEGEKRVLDCMMNGYPRFFIHLSIVKLASICEQRYTIENEQAMLFPTKKIAEHCRSFIQRRLNSLCSSGKARLVHLFICSEDKNHDTLGFSADLHIVLFPKDAFSIAKEFWQHTGLGISSRLAEKCLSLLPEGRPLSPGVPNTPPTRHPALKSHNRHYSAAVLSKPSSPQTPSFPPVPPGVEEFNPDQSVYLEERYGRNLPLNAAALAKQILRLRVAGVLLGNSATEPSGQPSLVQEDKIDGLSVRGITEVSADDVYLYPCGMAAIWNAHNILLSTRPLAKSVCFGFPYTDTLKVLQKWGPGCHFLGHGLDSDIDALKLLLDEEVKRNPDRPPLLALFTEFPSNPLLRSANLPRLRELADQYDFLIVVDETIGNFVNVQVLPYADIVVSSLTKIFSGASNVMGGSLVLNPRGRYYQTLKEHLNNSFEDVYFDEDAVYLERNSRDFKRRIRVIDTNAEAACDFLHARSIAGGEPTSVIKEVFYPKYITRENYDICRNTAADQEDGKLGGFGGLFSVTFTSMAAAEAFFDALQCHKGPSLGTNFTLACPFTILAHFTELDWANQYGVEPSLVRVSVGMEEPETLLSWMTFALEAAEAAAAL